MKFLKLSFLILIFVLISTFAHSQTQANGTANAEVVQPISCSYSYPPLNFGAIKADPLSASSVTITPEWAPRVTTDFLSNVSVYDFESQSAASFNIQGKPNAQFIVALPTSATLTNSESDTVTVTDFKVAEEVTYSYDFSETTFNLDETGKLDIYVAGTLNIGAAQPNGYYLGTFRVTVNYQ